MNHVKKLKKRIKELEDELRMQDSSHKAMDKIVRRQHKRQMVLTQEVTFLLLYLEAIETIIKDDYSSNAKTVKKAICIFKNELKDGFADNHLITKLFKTELDNDEIIL